MRRGRLRSGWAPLPTCPAVRGKGGYCGHDGAWPSSQPRLHGHDGAWPSNCRRAAGGTAGLSSSARQPRPMRPRRSVALQSSQTARPRRRVTLHVCCPSVQRPLEGRAAVASAGALCHCWFVQQCESKAGSAATTECGPPVKPDCAATTERGPPVKPDCTATTARDPCMFSVLRSAIAST